MKRMKQFCSLLLAGAILATSVAPTTVSAAAWRKNSVGWWYQEDNGSYPANQWKAINGNWYWFNRNGYMVTGWQNIGGSWYYFQSSGAMIGQGWHVINGSWYYMYASGAMASNTWIGDSYVNGSGAWVPGKTRIQAGWVKSGNRWWYRHADGSYTKNGWEKIGSDWYLFDSAGWMLTGWQYVGGSWYYLQASGAMYGEGWHQINGDWYYMYADGVMAANTWIGNYYVNSSGVRIDATNGVYLLDLVKPYVTPYHYEEYMDKSFKMGGKCYTNGFTCMGYGDVNEGNVTYFNLNGEYSQISFTIGVLDEHFNGDSSDKVTFRVIADGKEVDRYTMKYGDLPVTRTVSIKNCKQLKISVYSYQSTAFYDGYYGLAEIKVKK